MTGDRSQRSRDWIKHLRTQLYWPQTNGKVERFPQTMAREWAYRLSYRSYRHRKGSATLARPLQHA